MLLDSFVDVIAWYVKIFEKLFSRISIRFRVIRFGPLEFELKKSSDTSYEKTLEKIELTKVHLSEAANAIDNLKGEIVQKKQELDQLLGSLAHKQNQKVAVDKEYEVSKRLRDEEAERLREVLGIYELKESRSGKVAGFIAGVVASLVAAALYALTTKFIL